MSSVDPQRSRASVLASEEFSFAEALGGWRGFAESVTPGLLFVVSYLVWGGFRVPVIAALSAVVVMVAVRLIQRSPITQALSGTIGVALGAVWAWTTGDPAEYFVPGFWITAAYGLAMLVSLAVRWPLVGVVFALIKGWDSWWRKDARAMRRFTIATWIFAASQVIKLAVQLPLYFAGAVAALGTARLAMGLPYFALTLWILWLVVRGVKRPPDPSDQPQQP